MLGHQERLSVSIALDLLESAVEQHAQPVSPVPFEHRYTAAPAVDHESLSISFRVTS